MTKVLFKDNQKLNVSYKVNFQQQTYNITEVVEGGDSWDIDKMWQYRNAIVNAIHYSYSKIQ